jgi:plasmid stabilization system protein ParE
VTPFILAPAAEADVIEIAAYIESDNPAAARGLVMEIHDWFARLAERPDMGHRRADLTPLPVQFWPVRRRYLIVHRRTATHIEIVRGLNARRDVAALLEGAGDP